jgi:hypothetical protein
MALVDPNIAMGYRGIEVPNQLAQYGQLAQIQNAQNQNSLAQYQLGAAQRAEAKDVARTNALSKAGTDDTAIANALLQSGDLKGYSDFLKTRRETQKADAELVDTKLKQSRSFLDTIDPSDPDAPNKYIAWHEANHKDPVLGPVLAARGITADQSRQRIMDAIQKGPAAFATLVNQSKLGSEKFIEMNKPQLSTKDTGGQLIDRTFEPLTGKITPLGTTAKTMTPGDIASNQVARGQLGVSQGQLALAQQRLAQEAQGVTYQVNDQGDIVALPSRLSAGAAPVARPVTGQDGAPVKGAAKSKDISVSEQQASYNVSRVLNAANQIKEIGSTNPSSGKPGVGEAFASSIGMEGTANLARSADRQIVYGAQRDALDALLYLATGAAYNKEQLAGQMAAYIPAFTDKADAVSAKKARLAELVKSAKIRAGKAWTPDMESAMQTLVSAEAPAAAKGKKPTAATPYSNLSNEELLKQLSGGN